VCGRAGSSTNTVGTMYSGSRSARNDCTSAVEKRRPARLLGHPSRLGGSHQVGHEPLVPAFSARGHRRLVHLGMPEQRRLDVPRLDAKPRTFTCVSRRPRKLEGAVRQPSHEVSRAVEARPGLTVRVRDETVRRQLGAVPVAAGEPVPRGHQLSRRAHRDRVQRRIQHVDLRVGDGLPMGTLCVPDLSSRIRGTR
jgi:hypothetical protein